MTEYVAYKYSEVPTPMDAITDPTPAERAEQETRKKAEEAAAASSKAESPKPDTRKKSFFDKLTSVAEDVMSTTQKTTATVVSTVQSHAKKVVDDYAQKRFTATFPSLCSKPLLGDYACKVLVNSNKPPFALNGYIDIVDSHVCFVGDHKPSSFSIPISDIVSLKLGLTLPVEPGTPCYVIPHPAPNVVPSVLQIYMKADNVLHQFGFFSSFKEAASVIDHAVRAVVSFPVPGVTYK